MAIATHRVRLHPIPSVVGYHRAPERLHRDSLNSLVSALHRVSRKTLTRTDILIQKRLTLTSKHPVTRTADHYDASQVSSQSPLLFDLATPVLKNIYSIAAVQFFVEFDLLLP